MRTLTGEGVPNITQPTAEYPFGKFKNKSSANTNDGTELSERVLGDCYQGMLNTITGAGITPNNEPEKKGDSQFQKAVELLKPVAVAVIGENTAGNDFVVLASKVRDPAITLDCRLYDGGSDAAVYFANFNIKRNGSVDTSRRYIITASPAFNMENASAAALLYLPKIAFVHRPYFNNVVPAGLEEAPNFFYLFPQAVSFENARALSAAIVTIYDAGAAS